MREGEREEEKEGRKGGKGTRFPFTRREVSFRVGLAAVSGATANILAVSCPTLFILVTLVLLDVVDGAREAASRMDKITFAS